MPLGNEGLGRGLQDVLAKTMRRDPPRGYLEVDIGLVIPPGANPRQQFDQTALDELAASISRHGILQPIVVLRKDVGYEVLSGERRYRAAKQAGLSKIPVVIREGDNPQHVAELRLIENLQREDLNPVDLAEAYQRLLTEHGLTHEDLAVRLNKNRTVITNTIRVLQLPDDLRLRVRMGTLSMGHAKALLGITDPDWQRRLGQRIFDEDLSVRESERLAAGPPIVAPAAPIAVPLPPHIRELEENLRLLFGTKVTLKERKGGKGAMTVHFQSRDHFQRLLSVMAKFVDQSKKVGP